MMADPICGKYFGANWVNFDAPNLAQFRSPPLVLYYPAQESLMSALLLFSAHLESPELQIPEYYLLFLPFGLPKLDRRQEHLASQEQSSQQDPFSKLQYLLHA